MLNQHFLYTKRFCTTIKEHLRSKTCEKIKLFNVITMNSGNIGQSGDSKYLGEKMK